LSCGFLILAGNLQAGIVAADGFPIVKNGIISGPKGTPPKTRKKQKEGPLPLPTALLIILGGLSGGAGRRECAKPLLRIMRLSDWLTPACPGHIQKHEYTAGSSLLLLQPDQARFRINPEAGFFSQDFKDGP